MHILFGYLANKVTLCKSVICRTVYFSKLTKLFSSTAAEEAAMVALYKASIIKAAVDVRLTLICTAAVSTAALIILFCNVRRRCVDYIVSLTLNMSHQYLGILYYNCWNKLVNGDLVMLSYDNKIQVCFNIELYILVL